MALVWVYTCHFAVTACRLVIVGGGYIAAEQCCIYNGFGADVHLFFRGEHMLNGFDMENRLHLEEEFKKQGISLWPTYSPTKASWGCFCY